MKKFYVLAVAAMMVFSLNAKTAFLLLESSISNLPTENSDTELGIIAENPEQNAANWFNAQFVNKELGAFIQPSEISGALTNGFTTIWVNVDRVGISDIKDAGVSDGVVADLKTFVEAGGNLLLTKQATMVAHRIGRIYEPTFSSAGYHLGGDVWSINPQLGLWCPIGQITDRSEHPIFDDVEWDETLQTYMPCDSEEPAPYKVLPLVGAHPRTDNNCMWIDLFRKDPKNPTQKLNAEDAEDRGVEVHYANDNLLRLTEFEGDWNCRMLACWGQVQDFCSAGIVDMNPEANFKGRVLGIGFAAYQWGSSNDEYISNVKKLTKNAINYLAEASQGFETTKAEIKTVKMIENGQMVIINNGVRYNVLGAQVK